MEELSIIWVFKETAFFTVVVWSLCYAISSIQITYTNCSHLRCTIAVSLYIHMCAWNLNAKNFHLFLEYTAISCFMHMYTIFLFVYLFHFQYIFKNKNYIYCLPHESILPWRWIAWSTKGKKKVSRNYSRLNSNGVSIYGIPYLIKANYHQILMARLPGAIG